MPVKVFDSQIRIKIETPLRQTLNAAAAARHQSAAELMRTILRDGLRRLTGDKNQPPGPDLITA